MWIYEHRSTVLHNIRVEQMWVGDTGLEWNTFRSHKAHNQTKYTPTLAVLLFGLFLWDPDVDSWLVVAFTYTIDRKLNLFFVDPAGD